MQIARASLFSCIGHHMKAKRIKYARADKFLVPAMLRHVKLLVKRSGQHKKKRREGKNNFPSLRWRWSVRKCASYYRNAIGKVHSDSIMLCRLKIRRRLSFNTHKHTNTLRTRITVFIITRERMRQSIFSHGYKNTHSSIFSTALKKKLHNVSPWVGFVNSELTTNTNRGWFWSRRNITG
jgi:REP element-mobilizing transposase RayT